MLRKLSLPNIGDSYANNTNNTNTNSSSNNNSPATPTPTPTSTNPFSSSSTALSSPSSLNIPASLTDPSQPFPKLIVFDLDYTLWPFWVDTHVVPPLKVNAQHTAATDRSGEDFAFYKDVPSILLALPYLNGSFSSASSPSSRKIKLGVASRTSAPSLARELLKGLHLDGNHTSSVDDTTATTKKVSKKRTITSIEAFDGGLEIYSGTKIKHFEALGKRTGIAFEDMLFFDDEHRNLETERLGLTMRLVRDGVTWEEVGKGVEEWRRRRMLREE